MSGRLKLRRGVVVAERPLTVEVDGEQRPAWADTALLGEMREGDELVVEGAVGFGFMIDSRNEEVPNRLGIGVESSTCSHAFPG